MSNSALVKKFKSQKPCATEGCQFKSTPNTKYCDNCLHQRMREMRTWSTRQQYSQDGRPGEL